MYLVKRAVAYHHPKPGQDPSRLPFPHPVVGFGQLSFTQGYRNEEVGRITFQSAAIALHGMSDVIYDGYLEGYTVWMESGVELGIIVRMRVEKDHTPGRSKDDPVVKFVDLYVDPNQVPIEYPPMEG